MIYCQSFVVLLFSIVAFSQLSPTIASDQSCSRVIPSRNDTLVLDKLFNSTCVGFFDFVDCTIDLNSYSTNGDPNFVSTCNSAGGEVYNVDSIGKCPSNDSDNVTKLTINNEQQCWAHVCDARAVRAAQYFEQFL